MCCFPSCSFLPFLCSVCTESTAFSLILHFQGFLMGSGRAFCFAGGIALGRGLDTFWVVSTSTDRLLVQAGLCQVYFKLSQISVLCQSDFSPARASEAQSSQVFQFFRIPECFHGWCSRHSLVLTMEILVFKQSLVTGKQKSISPVL